MVFTTKAPSWQVKWPSLRTQTKIKNYFYGNIRYLLKIILKTVTKVKTGFINDVRTDILLDIYEGKNGKCILMQILRDSVLSIRPLDGSASKLTRSRLKSSSSKINSSSKILPISFYSSRISSTNSSSSRRPLSLSRARRKIMKRERVRRRILWK